MTDGRVENRVTEIFGYILCGASVVLAAFEFYNYRNRTGDAWLATKRRLQRRMMISFVLAAIGVMFVLDARGIFFQRQVALQIAFLIGTTCLAVLLLVLAALDVMETVRGATRESLREIERAIEEERRRQSAQGGGLKKH